MKVGIIGGGQLARMMIQASSRLALDTVILDPKKNSPAGLIGESIIAELNDPKALEELSSSCDIITYELEHLNLEILSSVLDPKKVFPNLQILEIAQDRLLEKKYINDLDIDTANFRPINSIEDIENIQFDSDCFLKLRKSGFDGRGQLRVNDQKSLISGFQKFECLPAILEQCIEFDFECSIIVGRNKSDEYCFYPITENLHHNGILIHTKLLNDNALQQQAEDIARKVMGSSNYIGVMGIEFFNVSGNLVVNEIAPRVHNSGHWTIDGANCSQFELHLRCITNLEIPHELQIQDVQMFNILGSMPNLASLSMETNIFIHDYKKSPRENRKIGHINGVSMNNNQIQAIKQLLFL